MSLTAVHMKRYRAVILNLLEANHRAQKSRMDHIMLGLAMRGLGCGVGEYDVLTLLQDLCDRGYVRYDEKKNRLTNDTEISRIEITAAGRDVLEETRKDEAVGL